MPPMVIDLRRAEDARDVVHRAVQALAEGHSVAFPTETDYVVAVAARHAVAAARLRAVSASPADEPPLTLALKKPLPAGTYDVRWQAAAADGHAMTGKVTFSVS